MINVGPEQRQEEEEQEYEDAAADSLLCESRRMTLRYAAIRPAHFSVVNVGPEQRQVDMGDEGLLDEEHEQEYDPLLSPVVLQQESPESKSPSPSSTPPSSRAASPSLALFPPLHPATPPEHSLSPEPQVFEPEPGPAALETPSHGGGGAHVIQDPANRAQYWVDGHFPTRDFRVEGYSVGTPGVREISVEKLRSLFGDDESTGRYLLRFYCCCCSQYHAMIL